MIPTAQALADITAALGAAGVESPRREARLILAAAHGLDAAGLLARAEVDPALYTQLVQRRAAREPLAYITGVKEFWGLNFRVSPATLIPRPDSETLIEAALAIPKSPNCILDLGTGTGCLLLAALSEYPSAFGIGVDSPAAAALAQQNATALGLAARAAFLAGDWAASLNARFDLILSNPPYIAEDELPALMPEVRLYEPSSALIAGPDGLAAYRVIIAALPSLLAPNGAAILELGATQAPAIARLATQAGLTFATRLDLNGHARAAILRPK